MSTTEYNQSSNSDGFPALKLTCASEILAGVVLKVKPHVIRLDGFPVLACVRCVLRGLGDVLGVCLMLFARRTILYERWEKTISACDRKE